VVKDDQPDAGEGQARRPEVAERFAIPLIFDERACPIGSRTQSACPKLIPSIEVVPEEAALVKIIFAAVAVVRDARNSRSLGICIVAGAFQDQAYAGASPRHRQTLRERREAFEVALDRIKIFDIGTRD
jgi:hypothetical protein